MEIEGTFGQEGSGGEAQGQESLDSGTGINPAWNDVLGIIPQELHSQVTPYLSKWDQGVQKRFDQVHSQYADYKPFIDNQVSPEDINFSLGIMNAINNDPQAMLEALQGWIEQEQGGQQDQQQTAGQGQNQNALTQDPEYQNMRQMVDSMAQEMISQREQEQQAQMDRELDEELSRLKTQFGDYDEQFVLSRMAIGKTGEEAVTEWNTLTQQILSGARRPGPKVLGSGGALPSNDLDVRKMNSKDTRTLVAQMLEQANQQQ